MSVFEENEDKVLTLIGERYSLQPNIFDWVKMDYPGSNITKKEQVNLPKSAKLENIICIDQKDVKEIGLSGSTFSIAFESLKNKGYFIGIESHQGDEPFKIYTDRNGHSSRDVEFDIKEFWGDYRIEVVNLFLTKYNTYKLEKQGKSISNKIKIHFSKDRGFYHENFPQSYAIRGKRASLIILMQDFKPLAINKKTSASLGYKNEKDIYKYIEKINDKFKEDVGFNKYDIILKVETGGYKLNNEDFDIVFD
ncbi:MAG: hypothetical protein PHQ18_04820 [Patescibacteria group bacterium]|nr:hypothetical protein [Patescibacteria group bacterium]